MRRLAYIFLAIELVFLGGSAYYTLVFPIRVFHQLLLTVLLALWLFNRLRHKQGLPQTPLNWPLYAATAVWTITALSSLDPRMAFENLWFQFIHVLFFWVLVELFQRGRQRLVIETQFLVASLVVLLSGLELASWYFGLGFIPGTDIGWVNVVGPGAWLPLPPPRLSLALNVSTLLAGYVAPLVILTAAWALTAHRQYRKVLWMLAGALLVVLMLTLSRGGILSILAATAFVVVIRLSQTPEFTRRFPARFLLAGAAAAGIVALVVFFILSMSTSRSWGDAGRLDMWRSAIAITRDHPLTGVGPGLFGHALREYRDPSLAQEKIASAHNAYLNTAAETGLPGILVSLWLGITLLRAWLHNWRCAESVGRKLRLEAALGALVGLGVHSLVDVFTITPIVLLIALLAAYAITPLPSGLTRRIPIHTTHPALAAVALLLVLVYGVWFIQLDRAQSVYQSSFGDPKLAYTRAQAAVEIDPYLDQYRLHIAHLAGQQLPVDQAISVYEDALRLEPMWNVGWMNLAALRLRLDDQAGALAALDKARNINVRTPASLHWAQIAEELQAAPPQAIVEAYLVAIQSNPALPLSDFWWATDLRRQAAEQFLTESAERVDWQYRVLAAHDPERAYALVPENPQTAAEYWVAGEYALTVEQDTAQAVTFFAGAIERARTEGDYYVSRARAEIQSDLAAARRDLDLATLLDTYAEYPNAIRAELATSPEEVHQLRADALPSRQLTQEYAAALYGRPSVFDLLPEVRAVGPGHAAMQPWYAIAETYLNAGQTDRAITVYQAILDYAPDESEAREALQSLNAR